MNPKQFRVLHRTAATLLALLLSCTASAAVIFPKVINTNDSGNGSLRAAIQAANGNFPDGAIIDFKIGSSCGPHVIHLSTPLPDLLYETHIEGYTQPGSSKNTLNHYSGNDAVICIVLAGDNTIADGLTVPSTVASSMTMSVLGVAFSGFTHAAVNLRGGSGHGVYGIRTGGSVGGVALDTNSYGVILAPGVHDAVIGGPDDGGTNQFGDITHNAIYVESSTGATGASHGNMIAYNNIGSALNGTTRSALPTGGAGIAIGGYANVLRFNDIENAGAAGVHISNTDAHDNSLYLSAVFNNAGDGILIDDDAHDNDFSNVEVSGNMGAGFRVASGQGNDIEFNNTYNNAGLGIDLATEGVTPNDNDSMQPVPDYANRGQNFPTLTSAAGGHFSGTISGTLTTTPGDYYIGIHLTYACDASGYGEGQNGPNFKDGTTGLITVPNLTVQGQGSVSFSLPVSVPYSAQPFWITATATDSNGNTSEFSTCLPYIDDTIFVDSFESSPR